MKLVPVDYGSQVPELMARLAEPGLLLVVRDAQRPANAMAIGWALFGRVWSQPMCTVLVRPSRYTFDLINRAGRFSVNLMPPGFESGVTRCGTVSGRGVDKIAEQGWTVATGETLDVPYIAQAALHLECRTVLTNQVTRDLDATLLASAYPRGDLHTIYHGLVTGIFRHEL
jgi:flavin reductase (DIM6/NTAB) family NADH-FMN oxidoreductase RutF